MDGSIRLRSLGRFLYTQNPFYLISCALIIYGLQITSISRDLDLQSTFLAISLAGYTALMSLVVIIVVRYGKVWEDARSIFLVVMIGHLAVSSGIDLLSLDRWALAARLLLGGFLFSLMTSEIVLYCCAVRLPAWYRACYYTSLAVFYAAPVVGGYCVSENQLRVAQWLAPIFSCCIGLSLLMLVPATRQGNRYVKRNGTPWSWPCYPLCAYVVVLVGAGIRSHAIWMSYGSFFGAVVFEPFLILPLVVAALVVLGELADRLHLSQYTGLILGLAPLMVTLGLSQQGMTNLSIRSELREYFGSAITLSLACLVLFYLYFWKRRIAGAGYLATIAMLALGLFAPLPAILVRVGLAPWIITCLSLALFTLTCLAQRRNEWNWLAWGSIGMVSLLQLGAEHNLEGPAIVAASLWAMTIMMTVGWYYDSLCAEVLRGIAAVITIATGAMLSAWAAVDTEAWMLVVLIAVATIAIIYGQIMRRTGWFWVGGIQTSVLLGFAVYLYSWNQSVLTSAMLPIQSGVICLVVGLTITTMKTGVRQRIVRRITSAVPRMAYRSGF